MTEQKYELVDLNDIPSAARIDSSVALLRKILREIQPGQAAKISASSGREAEKIKKNWTQVAMAKRLMPHSKIVTQDDDSYDIYLWVSAA